ncbi:hypothetical protein P170DRAFT_441439 [Aspergillus steynii IBT 23096]|uniref:GPI anchored serine-threonine rich protein n=1 Tax=Aspergillus steynii IBT 23096 TaxID=1392250 RepID=A0A2I2FTS3_9EURO|nr:uncharacterized protein P170DRAFT_441439 [Aspergillus steynii IBT 23096]PLB44001.1 hypothetical protein P170DRAFT_441439 [Aspergillus steynii IBT 23096]
MKFTLLTLLASCLLAVSAAETSSATSAATATSNAICAKEILQACLERMEPQLKKCTPNRWDCLCEQTNNVLTCYNNCTGHADRLTTEQQRDSYCRAAKAASMTVSTSTTAKPTSTQDASKTKATGDEASAAEASATSSASEAGTGAVAMGMGGGAVAAFVVGVLGMV